MSKKNKRSETREALMKILFQMEIQGDFSDEAEESFISEYLHEGSDEEYFRAAFAAYICHNNEIDDLIEKYSKGWRIERLAKVDLSVLRLCITEMMYLKKPAVPQAAAINEAVRIVKLYSGEDSGKFVNGILGRISREEKPEEAAAEGESAEGDTNV